VPLTRPVTTRIAAGDAWTERQRRQRREVALTSHDERAATTQHPALDSSLQATLRRLPVRQREVITLRRAVPSLADQERVT
jgi:DNA-directed RNA polymerase specialized sigma24 family protein